MKTFPHHCVLWLWAGWRDIYSYRHVNATAAALQRWNPGLRVLAVVSDAHRSKIKCEAYAGWQDAAGSAKQLRQHIDCFRRLRLFDSATQEMLGIASGDTVHWLDLDTVLTGTLPSLPSDSSFAACAGLHAHYNGSIVAFRGGTMDVVYQRYLTEGAAMIRTGRKQGIKLIGSDQAYMSLAIHGGHRWTPAHHGVYPWPRYGVTARAGIPKGAVLWTYPGAIKPWHSANKQATPALYDAYMQDYTA